MERFNELLEKRKKLTASIYEEEELIELSKKMTSEQLEGIDRSLLIPSNNERLDKISLLLDKLSNKLDEIKKLK